MNKQLKLRCSNPDCCTRTSGDYATFSITVSVGSERELAENLHKVEAEHFSCDMCNEPAEDALPHRLKKMEDDNRVPGWHAQSTEHPCQAWAERREDAINALHKLVEEHKAKLAAKASGKSNWTPDASGSVTFKV